jgi:uncharacterized protein YueI
MNAIQKYLMEQAHRTDNVLDEKALLLGCESTNVVHFVTYKELRNNFPLQHVKAVKEMAKSKKVKLIINGNLSDTMIERFMRIALHLKKTFSVVVMDGFVALDNQAKNSKDIALVLAHHEE